MSGLGKELLVFDATEANSSDNVGAYLRSADGTLLTHTTEGAKEALDVSIANTSITVTATDLDIRDLDFAQDSVDVSGSEVSLDAATLAALENITVSATDLDIRDLVFATDKVDVSGSEVSLDATTLAALENITVSATDLDIRDLDHAQDNVAIAQGGNTMTVNADGSINVNADIDVVNGAEKEEDAAHASGDIGQYILAVRQDTLAASVDTDGDYASLKVDSLGRLWAAASVSGDVADDAADAGNPIKVGTRALTGPLAALSASGDRADMISDLYRRLYVNDSANIAIASAEVSVADSALQLDTVPLPGRREITIQNTANQAIYIGPSGVTTSNGLRVGAGGSYTVRLGQHVPLYAISATVAAKAVRVLQLA